MGAETLSEETIALEPPRNRKPTRNRIGGDKICNYLSPDDHHSVTTFGKRARDELQEASERSDNVQSALQQSSLFSPGAVGFVGAKEVDFPFSEQVLHNHTPEEEINKQMVVPVTVLICCPGSHRGAETEMVLAATSAY
ncbi:cyanobacterial porin [Anopheles sinensis]|uniref:Cyanobacterial porin n=1 Tax=Anopheles sinensis TaxID=74873 RepID=A0A084W1E1_ANOSI|nr:cyanobacterial porin [Anopheles sinensis]